MAGIQRIPDVLDTGPKIAKKTLVKSAGEYDLSQDTCLRAAADSGHILALVFPLQQSAKL